MVLLAAAISSFEQVRTCISRSGAQICSSICPTNVAHLQLLAQPANVEGRAFSMASLKASAITGASHSHSDLQHEQFLLRSSTSGKIKGEHYQTVVY